MKLRLDVIILLLALSMLFLVCFRFLSADFNLTVSNLMIDRITQPPLEVAGDRQNRRLRSVELSDHQIYNKVPWNTKKVVLYTYMRGGSTLLGELFNQNPYAIYWYEIYDAFYMGRYGLPIWNLPLEISHHPNGTPREIGEEERLELLQYTEQLFACDLTSLPLEALLHPMLGKTVATNKYFSCFVKAKAEGMKKCGSFTGSLCTHHVSTSIERNCPEAMAKTRQCFHSSPGQEHICDRRTAANFSAYENCLRQPQEVVAGCLPRLQNACLDSRIHAAKILRVPMSFLGPLLEAIPDLYVVHYVRDPRGILSSRRAVPSLERGNLLWDGSKNDVTKEAKVLCKKMLEDVRVRKSLEQRYPDTFLTLKYEDLAIYPNLVATKVYKHIGERLHGNVITWLEDGMNDVSKVHRSRSKKRREINLAYSTHRANATQTAYSWRQKLTDSEITEINKHCHEVYKELGYSFS